MCRRFVFRAIFFVVASALGSRFATGAAADPVERTSTLAAQERVNLTTGGA
jgi:hypothetical protein